MNTTTPESPKQPERPASDGGAAPDPVQLTRALVAIPSVNPEVEAHGSGEAEVADRCARWLEEWGFAVEVREAAPGRVSVVARRGRGAPRLILNGHLDTVGVEGMTIDPFDPEIRNGRLHGRGSCDMKSGVAAILATAHALAPALGPSSEDPSTGAAAPERLPGELIVVLTCDEEHASIGLSDLLAEGLTADAAIVTEPTSLEIAPANKGFLWHHVVVRGVAAHGSRPDVGRDAIRGMGRILSALDRFEEIVAAEDEPHPLLGRSSIHAGTIRGGSAPSVYPDRCELTLETRLLPGETPERVRARLDEVLTTARRDDPELDVTVTEELHRLGSEIAGDHPVVEGLASALQAEGLPVRVAGMTAWVESAFFNEAGIPSLCFGPGSIGKAHSADEFVPVEEIGQAARVLERFSREFFGGAWSTQPAG